MLATAGMAIVVISATGKSPHDVIVNLDLYNGSDPCEIGLGYDDIPGALVAISADGVAAGTATLDYFGTDEGSYCRFTATVPKVPTDKTAYELTIGGANRGALDATRSDLAADDWTWGVTLGD